MCIFVIPLVYRVRDVYLTFRWSYSDGVTFSKLSAKVCHGSEVRSVKVVGVVYVTP